MSTNLSKQKREDLLNKIEEIRKYLKTNLYDENARQLAGYLSELSAEINGQKYGLVFEEHKEAIDEKLENNLPVLTEEKELFVGNGGEMNFLLEGDNLASLQLLEKTHKGKIDVIYIDPPYNTGNKDFIYDDDFVDSADSFRHSKWLSFMEKRLRIARELLSEKGVIFISIDDNEQADLKLLCDEVFGLEKFASMFPWRKRTAKSDVPFGISQDYEWILCYANCNFVASIEGKERKYFETEDFPNKPWRFHDLTKQRTIDERPNSNYTMINPKTGEEYPVNPIRCWAVTKDTFQQYYDEGRIIFPGDYDFLKISKPVLRYWKEDDIKKAGANFGRIAVSTKFPDTVGMSQDGTKEITEILKEKAFLYPKSLELIKFLLQLSTFNSQFSTVLDFFAGSGTTGHAVLKLNAEDGGHRKFILCTNNENGICRDITYERLKTVITSKRKDGSKYSDGLSGSLKYFKVDFVEITEKEYYEYADKLLLHVRELVELENALDFEHNKAVAIVLTEEELEEFMQSLASTTLASTTLSNQVETNVTERRRNAVSERNRTEVSERSRTEVSERSRTEVSERSRTVYLGHDVLLSKAQKELLKKNEIELKIIPQYYYPELNG